MHADTRPGDAYFAAAQEDRCAPRTRIAIPATLRPSGGRGFQTMVRDISTAGFAAAAVLHISLLRGVTHSFADAAAIFAEQLGIDVPANRITVALKPGDVAVVGQYRGPRLPEGCHVLPEGATIQWIKLEM